jgi:cytochrome c-type biogenesis protein CcmH/NrfG
VQTSGNRGLPPRVYVPIAAVFAVVFLLTLAWLVRLGFGTSGGVFGTGTGSPGPAAAQQQQPQTVNVEGGGPPATVRMQLQELRARIARNPKDDVALTQLGDMYLAVGKSAQAIPYYKRALAANPGNVAAKEGLSQAQTEARP